ncbi:MAG TPA: transglycosylase domain-containing protein [Patescibacteria group bacterium]|nr:transglycosylase domain-containing protein [Patescibacteria group bacterium]
MAKKNYNRLEIFIARFQKRYLLIIPLGLILIFFYFYILKDLPSPIRLSTGAMVQSSQIYDRNGKLLYTIYGNRNQSFVPLTQIPKTMQEATISIEDKDFYNHGAIDLRGIARAFYETVFHKTLQGGSTLTQQLVKNSLLTQDQTVQRKIKEVILSFLTEAIYPKDKILELYLNEVPYGGTSYGVEAASETFFGEHASQLDLAQSAFLAGLPQEPSTFSPYGSHPELGIQRQQEVLEQMKEQNYITPTQQQQADKEQLHFQQDSNQLLAPHFVLYIKDLLIQKYGQDLVENGGLKVKTSLDLDLQNYAQATVAAEVAKVSYAHVTNGAALITDPNTGEILAMVGSVDYLAPGFGNVNMTLANLQPGSSIKPINYAVGLIKGYTAATPFIDEALCFGGNPPYCPVNYDGKFHGAIQMRYALGNSINIPAVEMLKLNGVDAMVATASAMGITTFTDPAEYGLSLTLGAAEVKMIDLATAYGVFANGGYRINLHPILQVTDAKGNILEQYNPPASPIFGQKVLPDGISFIMTHMLLDNNARLLEFGSTSELKIGNQPVAVKTGTTNDFRDNWTIGYTIAPSYLVSVWVGNNDRTPMNGLASGITGAAPIWHELMAHLLEGKEAAWPTQPENVIGKIVCNPSGLLVPVGGCDSRYEYFIKGTEPTKYDPGKQPVLIDKTTNDLAKPGQTDNVEMRNQIVITDPLGNKYCLDCPHSSPSPTPTPGH